MFTIFEILPTGERIEFGPAGTLAKAKEEGEQFLSSFEVEEVATGKVVARKITVPLEKGSATTVKEDAHSAPEKPVTQKKTRTRKTRTTASPVAATPPGAVLDPVANSWILRENARAIMAGMVFGVRTPEQMQAVAALAVAGAQALELALFSPVPLPSSETPQRSLGVEKTVQNGRTILRPR